MNSVIIGFGAALPRKCIFNDELPSELNTSDEWITRRTGIKRRYVAESETTASLAAEAGMKALRDAKVSPDDVDLVIVATVTGDLTFPATATIVQRDLGITHGAAFDINAACSGFIYALDVANSYIKCGRFNCALVIGAETFSRVVDWNDRSTCVLFGDGAGATLIQAQDLEDVGIRYCRIYSDGKFVDHLKTSGGVSTTRSAGIVEMDGREVFRFAVEKFEESLGQLMKDNNLSISDIDLVIPHQANVRIIDKMIEDLEIAREKVVITVCKHANTSAASIPLALHEIKQDLAGKKNVVLLSMGAGFTWGAALVSFPNSLRS